MDEGKIEEDTYSLILTSLKHPLRRKILRMLSESPLGFSEILESLSIDSGHLNYHLKNLGDLITRNENGKYMLSTAGWAAVRLMGKVEEQEESVEINKRKRRISKTTIVFSVLFAVSLLIATVYALTYTTQDQNVLFEVSRETENVSMVLQPNQQFDYGFSFSLGSLGGTIGYSINHNKTDIMVPQPTNNIVRWTRYFSDTRLVLKGTYSVYITVYDASGKIVIQQREDGDISSPQTIPIGFEFSEFGNYTLRIENLGAEDFTATLTPHGLYINYSRPLFNYGIIGVVILVLYPILLFVSWNLSIKRSTQIGRRFSSKLPRIFLRKFAR